MKHSSAAKRDSEGGGGVGGLAGNGGQPDMWLGKLEHHIVVSKETGN
jgi:hypothetical protein